MKKRDFLENGKRQDCKRRSSGIKLFNNDDKFQRAGYPNNCTADHLTASCRNVHSSDQVPCPGWLASRTCLVSFMAAD